MTIDPAQLSVEPIRSGRGRLVLDGHLIGWVMLTPSDGRRYWGVSTLVPWHAERVPSIRASSATAAATAWAEWVNRNGGNPVDTRPNVSGQE